MDFIYIRKQRTKTLKWKWSSSLKRDVEHRLEDYHEILFTKMNMLNDQIANHFWARKRGKQTKLNNCETRNFMMSFIWLMDAEKGEK